MSAITNLSELRQVLDQVYALKGATPSTQSSGGVSAVTPHTLADNFIHSATGLTAGQVLRATGAAAYNWQAIQAGDIPDISGTYAPTSRQIIAGAGLTGGGTLAADRTLAVGAGTLITVGADDVGITPGAADYGYIGSTTTPWTAAWRSISTLAGAGLTHSAGVLAVGAGNGITVNADDVALTTPGTLTVSSTNSASGSHTHAVTSVSTSTAAANLLSCDANGYLTLIRLNTDTLADKSGGNLTIAPAGDVIFNPTGNDILPTTGYDLNIGSLQKKYLTLHAAELWVETLVAQDTIATIGGRILVGPTTVLTSDLTDSATTIYVKHNEMASGDRVYLEANGSVEFMSIDSAPGGAGPYSYTVTRNLDGSGANAWSAGDAIFNTGTTGDGFIDLYSLRSVKSATQYGPAIVGNVRNSATYNDWTEAWAVGNLNGLYGYGVDTYGAAFGKYGSGLGNITIDPTNGVRLRSYTTDILQIKNTDGKGYIVGPLYLDTNGGIYQGTGTFASPTTGLKIWNDSGIGRLAGYNAGTIQTYFGTDGKLYAGAGNVILDANGIAINSDAANYAAEKALNINASGSTFGRLWGTGNVVYLDAYPASGAATLYLWSHTAADQASSVILQANASTRICSLTVSVAADGTRTVSTSNLDSFSINSGLNVGTATGAGAGDVYGSGELQMAGAGTHYVMGKWGVGTTGPSGRLHVYEAAGDEFFTSANTDGIILTNNVASHGIGLSASQAASYGSNGSVGIKLLEGNGVANAGTIEFYDDGAAGLTYKGGNVIIGGSVRSNDKFNVNGTDGVTSTPTMITQLQYVANPDPPYNTLLQCKSRTFTATGGIVTAVGAESGWTTVAGP